MEAVEMDFFGNYIKDFPLDAIAAQDKETQKRIVGLRDELHLIEAKAEECGRLLGIMQVQSISKQLEDYKKQKETIERQLDELTPHTHHVHVTGAWRSILSLFDADPANANGSLEKLSIASEEMKSQLMNKERRRKLLCLVPTLISGLVLDIKEQRYAVIQHGGKQTEWRDLAPYLNAIRWRHLHARRKPGSTFQTNNRRRATVRRNGQAWRARNIAKGLTSCGKPRQKTWALLRHEAVDTILKRSKKQF